MRDYRHKIDFLLPFKEYDDYGEKVDVWNPFIEGVWASKDPLIGNEFFSSLTAGNRVDVKFNMRYIPNIVSEMRIRHGYEIYDIIGPPINVKSLNRELLCYCKLVE